MNLSSDKPNVNLNYMIAVMQAFGAGHSVQEASRSLKDWFDTPIPSWNWNTFVYRIKPTQN